MTREQILSRLLSNISDEFDKSTGSFFYDTQTPLAAELETTYAKIAEILDSGFAATATGEYLDRKAAEQGMQRKHATYATGTVTITGDTDAVINIGDKVSSDTITFSVTETKTLTDGTAEVNIICDIPGVIGNLPVGSIKTFPVTLPGLVGVTNANPTTGGYAEETDDELRDRFFAKVSAIVTSGNVAHYMVWANEVEGVGGARVKDLWDGNGTVKVVIINADKQTADQNLINEVAAHIEAKRPAGANVTVRSATAKPIDVSFDIKLETGAVLDDAKAATEANLKAYIKKLAYSQDYVSYAGIGFVILNSAGVRDYAGLKINGVTENIDIADEEVAVIGTVTIT